MVRRTEVEPATFGFPFIPSATCLKKHHVLVVVPIHSILLLSQLCSQVL